MVKAGDPFRIRSLAQFDVSEGVRRTPPWVFVRPRRLAGVVCTWSGRSRMYLVPGNIGVIIE